MIVKKNSVYIKTYKLDVGTLLCMIEKAGNSISSVQTRYRGYNFRSRLEARYAVLFDSLGLKWEYEIEGYDLGKHGWYLPDFWLPEFNLFLEVKPTTDSKIKCEEFFNVTGKCILLACGMPGDNPLYLYSNEDTKSGGVSQTTQCVFGNVILYSAVTNEVLFNLHNMKLLDTIKSGEKINRVDYIKLIVMDAEYDFSLLDGKYNHVVLDPVVFLKDTFQYHDIICTDEERCSNVYFINHFNRRMKDYYNDAKSARFEYGECGAT
jgi:hypothetical protein